MLTPNLETPWLIPERLEKRILGFSVLAAKVSKKHMFKIEFESFQVWTWLVIKK